MIKINQNFTGSPFSGDKQPIAANIGKGQIDLDTEVPCTCIIAPNAQVTLSRISSRFMPFRKKN